VGDGHGHLGLCNKETQEDGVAGKDAFLRAGADPGLPAAQPTDPAITVRSNRQVEGLACLALAMLVGNALVYIPGLLWLNAMPYATSWDWTLAAGLWPFLIGDALKLALAAVLFPALWGLAARLRG
jgi:hypothetical protein